MKLCQRCYSAIVSIKEVHEALMEWYQEYSSRSYWRPEPVSDSECEFWAHEAYNRVRSILKAGIEDMDKEIQP